MVICCGLHVGEVWWAPPTQERFCAFVQMARIGQKGRGSSRNLFRDFEVRGGLREGGLWQGLVRLGVATRGVGVSFFIGKCSLGLVWSTVGGLRLEGRGTEVRLAVGDERNDTVRIPPGPDVAENPP